MIKVLSPYILTIPYISPETSLVCTKYEVKIYVWTGNSDSPPIEESYSITNENTGLDNGNSEIDISRFITDFLDYDIKEVVGVGLLDSDAPKWVKTEVYYTTGDEDDDGLAQLVETKLASLGYYYGNKPYNTETPTNKVLINSREFKISRESKVLIPIECDNGTVTIKSYPDLQIDESEDVVDSIDSSEKVKYITVILDAITTDEYIEVTYNDETITLLITEECRYTPHDIYFINKEGFQQSITMFKSKSERLSVKSENYESYGLQASDKFHGFVDYNVNGRSSFKINSGFVDEDYNETFKQLFLSSRIWVVSQNNYLPINIKSKSLEYKSRQKDRLINYEVEFEYSYNEINKF